MIAAHKLSFHSQPDTRMETLDHLTLISISGDDAEDFLQGQLTNDVSQLDDSWHFTGYCSPKGRLLALIRLWRDPSSTDSPQFFALIEHSVAESVIKKLRMYVLRSKVVIEELQNKQILGKYTAESDDSLASGSLSTSDIGTELGFGERALCIADQASTSDAIDGGRRWLSMDIQEGLPTIVQHTQEMFVPQMVNLDTIGGISFKKGCYTGQEIVARMHYLGKLKQRMYLCELEPATTDSDNPEEGARVITEEGKNAGNLVTSAINGLCLAVLRLDHIDSGLSLESGRKLTVSADQPYQWQ